MRVSRYSCLLIFFIGVLVLHADVHAAANEQPISLVELNARIKALEQHAQELQQQAQAALDAAHEAQAELAQMQSTQRQQQLEAKLAAVSKEAPAARGSGIGVGNAFNPAIAVILNGTYANHSLDDSTFGVEGFPTGGEAGPVAEGFSLGESEISLAANIDDKLYGQLTITAESEDGEDHVGVEEAFIDATALPAGFGLRAGRFFSNIGYLNSHHAHTDYFSVRPLAYQAFLGGHYGDDGVRVEWVAPTSTFMQLSAEAFRGSNYPAGGAQHDGIGAHTLAIHLGDDVGEHNAWLAGVSMLRAEVAGGDDGFSGRDTLYIADATWKWSHDGNFKDGGLLLRGEYMEDRRDGTYAPPAHVESADHLIADFMPGTMLEPWQGHRRGMYFEGVYNFNRRWSTGYRYDQLWAADEGPFASQFSPSKHSLMLSWRNSEFSLLRLQYSRAELSQNHADSAVIVQYQVALGAHGAHKF